MRGKPEPVQNGKLSRLEARHLLWLAAPLLLWLALRQVPLADLVGALGRLSILDILILLAVNVAALGALTARWWTVLKAQGYRLPYPMAVAYRLAAFAISYFTPGPQFGGEPLQTYLPHRRHGLPLGEAMASVVLDKVLEMLVNLAFLLTGVVVLIQLQLAPPGSSRGLVLAAAGLLLLPSAYLIAAAWGIQPASRLLEAAGKPTAGRPWVRMIHEAEEEVTSFCRQQPAAMVLALIVSLGSWAVLLAEYWLMARFLGLELSLLAVIGAMTASRLAFLLPIPGGLGTLEASQVLALTALGYSAADGAALAIVIRGRDVILGLVGLGLGISLSGGEKHTRLSPKP